MSGDMDEELERIREEKIKEIKDRKEGPEFPDSPIEATEDNFQGVVDRYPLVVFEFRADWCGACKSLDPLIDSLAEKYSEKVVFARIDVDRNPSLVKRFQVSGVPTLVVAKDGEFVDKMVGVSSPQDLESKIQSYLN